MPLRYVHDSVHLAAYSRIMHRHDYLGAGCNGSLNFRFIHVHRFRVHIDEYRHSPLHDKRIDCRDKGVTGANELIPGLQIAENGRHFQRCCAGMHQQCLFRAEVLFNPSVALLGEVAVSCKLTELDGLGNIPEFFADDVWFVERNFFHES